MSGPGPEIGEATETPVRGGRLPAPEVIGVVAAVIVLAIVGTSVLAGGGTPSAVGPSPTATITRPTIEPSATPPVDPSIVALLGAINQKLVDYAQALQRELDRSKLQTAEVASLIRQITPTVRLGADAVPKLRGFLGPEQPGGRLAALYQDITTSATDTLNASVRNDSAYRVGAGVLVKLIQQLPALQAALEALLIEPSPTVAPSVVASPPPSPSPPPPTPTPAPPTSSPTPAVASPSVSGAPASGPPSPAVDEQLENPDFEEGVGPPWVLLVGTGSAATLNADTTAPASGKTAARIDISVGSGAYGGISLQQSGLQVAAGGLYTVTLSARATTDREIRIRIASVDGASYLTRLSTIGSAWSQSVFTFIAPVTDSNAVLEIDLGRSTVTTWVDATSFHPTAAGP